jgi:hypothetical protein
MREITITTTAASDQARIIHQANALRGADQSQWQAS